MIGICDICHSLPHKNRCPEALEPQIAYICSECGEPIYVDDIFYRIGVDRYCERCVEDFKEYADVEDWGI